MPRHFVPSDYPDMRRLVREACAHSHSPYATLGDLDWWTSTSDPADSDACLLWHDPHAGLEAFLWPSGTQADIISRPGDAALYERVLEDWESRRVHGAPAKPCKVWAYASDESRNSVLARRKYTLAGPAFSLLARPLDSTLPALPDSPPRCLRPEEVTPALAPALARSLADTHRAAFNSARLTPFHFEAVLRAPTHLPSLHFIAQQPPLEMSGYAIAWLDRDNALGLIEPLAVVPQARGRGVGRALLVTALHRLAGAGARTALVNSSPGNSAAAALYASCGFHERDRNCAWHFA